MKPNLLLVPLFWGCCVFAYADKRPKTEIEKHYAQEYMIPIPDPQYQPDMPDSPLKPVPEIRLHNIRPHREPSTYGIDVSHHQGSINWNMVATDTNASFVYIKGTESTSHSDDEYQALYNKFIQQNIRDARQGMRDIQDNDDYIEEVNLKLSSLYYYDDNNWGCKINNRFVKKSNQNDAHNDVSIVKVNKDSILFVLNRTKEDDIEKIRKLKKSNYQYRSDYYIVKNGKTQSVMFRLHIGQSINLKSFKIK